MTLTFKDRVLESSTSTGTGDFVLTGPQTGYQGFTVVGNGATVPYTIQGKNPDGSLNGEWEVGEGTYHSSGNYISRDVVYESSNSNAKVAFSSGDKDVFLDLPGERIVQSPTIAVSNNFVAYDGVTGQIIKDSGSNAASFATAAQGAKADTAVQPGSLGTAAYLNAGSANGVATLDAGGKVPTSQIPQMGDLNYQGTWNASTNTPTLTSSVGTKGYYYVVSVSGSTNLDGITDWVIGDWAVFNGTVWQKIDNTDAVTSVNGYTGTVVLSYTDVGAAPATSGTSILYGNGSGGFSNVTIGSGVAFAGGTLSATGTGGDVVGPSSATDNAIARFNLTTGKLIQNSVVTIDDDGNMAGADSFQYSGTIPASTPIGTMWFDSATDTLNFKQNNITQQVGEELFVYGRADEAITDGQVIAVTGSWGTTGVVRFAPAPIGTTDSSSIIGIATEPIAKNAFGRVTVFGTVHDLNTTGYADGDVLWYDPTVVGGYTNVKPSAPNIKCQVGIITKAAGGTNGSIAVKVIAGSTLGGTDSNVQLGTPSNGQILTYDGTNTYWKNTSLTAGTAVSVSASATGVLTIANTAPDQVVSLTGAGTTTVTGTYPSFTITSNDQYTGTVTSVGGTGSVNGITLSGTVTTSGNLTLGGTLSNVSLTSQVTGTLPIANGGTNAVTAPAAIANLFGFTSTATAAGTTTLTNTSTVFQLFTGTTTQTVTLPVVSTLTQGWRFNIVNTSTGTVTVNSSGGNLVYAIPTNGAITVACIATSGTTAAAWVIADSTTAVWNA